MKALRKIVYKNGFFIFKKIALLRNIQHLINCTDLKCSVWYIWHIHPWSQSRNAHITPKRFFVPVLTPSHSSQHPHPSPSLTCMPKQPRVCFLTLQLQFLEFYTHGIMQCAVYIPFNEYILYHYIVIYTNMLQIIKYTCCKYIYIFTWLLELSTITLWFIHVVSLIAVRGGHWDDSDFSWSQSLTWANRLLTLNPVLGRCLSRLPSEP